MTRRSVLLLVLALSALPLVAAPYSADDLVERALDHSETIRIQGLEAHRSASALKERRAAFFPTVDLQGSASYMTNPPEGITISKGQLGSQPSAGSEMPTALPDQDYVLMPDTEHTYFRVSATLTQPVFTWNKLRNAVELARIAVEIAATGLDRARREVARDVRTAYFGAVLARDSAVSLALTVDVLAEIHRDRVQWYNEDLVTRQDVLEASSNLAQARSGMVAAEEGYRTALEVLAMLCRLDPGDLELTQTFRTGLPVLEEDRIREEMLRASPQLRELRLKVQQAERYVEIERAGGPLRPDVSLVFSMDVTGQRIPILGANWTDSWDANFIFTLGTKVTLWDSLQSRYKTEQARDSAAIAATGLEQLQRAVGLSARRALEAARTAHARVAEIQARLDYVEEQTRNAAVSYENELITRGELRGAQVLLHTTELERLAALFAFESALIELEYLTDSDLE